MDHYRVIGVKTTDTMDEITRAYRKKAKLYHPDINKNPGAEDEMKRLNESYDYLKIHHRQAAPQPRAGPMTNPKNHPGNRATRPGIINLYRMLQPGITKITIDENELVNHTVMIRIMIMTDTPFEFAIELPQGTRLPIAVSRSSYLATELSWGQTYPEKIYISHGTPYQVY